MGTTNNVKEWGPKANDIDCTQDIQGRLTKMKAMRRECKNHQALEHSLGPNTPFENQVPDGKGGFTAVNCIMGGQGMCKKLHCYSDDPDLEKGIAQLTERAKTCRSSMDILAKEEEANGPVGEEAQVTARAGGEPHSAAVPVDVGLA